MDLHLLVALIGLALMVAFLYRATQQARQGKGWLAVLGRKRTAQFWRAMLRPRERLLAGGIGLLDKGVLPEIRGSPGLDHRPWLCLAITDHRRLLMGGLSMGPCRGGAGL